MSISVLGTVRAGAQEVERVRLRFDTAEAVAVLTILESGSAGRPVAETAWQTLFATEGYVRLKTRESAVGRAFTDSSFMAFVRSDSLGRRASALRVALSAWERADVDAATMRALAYLPGDARIRATVYLMIKPRTNSFVHDLATDPAIFLYLDPAVTAAQFANTVAHELHHIGLASAWWETDSILATLPDSIRPVAEWIGALGEGFAMLAAAGGPDIHPHAASSSADRSRWDADVARFNHDLAILDRFFMSILARRLASADTIRSVAATFYGVQGPWYTVGWKMAVVIERRFDRAELIRCMLNPHQLLARYNSAAAEYNRTHADSLALWSTLLVAALQRASPRPMRC